MIYNYVHDGLKIDQDWPIFATIFNATFFLTIELALTLPFEPLQVDEVSGLTGVVAVRQDGRAPGSRGGGDVGARPNLQLHTSKFVWIVFDNFFGLQKTQFLFDIKNEIIFVCIC